MGSQSRRSLLSSILVVFLSGCVSSTVELSGKTSIVDVEVMESEDVTTPTVVESVDDNLVKLDSIYLSYPCSGYDVSVSPDTGSVTGSGIDVEVSTNGGSGSSCSVQADPTPVGVTISFESLVGGIPIRIENPNETLEYTTTGKDNRQQLR